MNVEEIEKRLASWFLINIQIAENLPQESKAWESILKRIYYMQYKALLKLFELPPPDIEVDKDDK
jgi:hypothetical protein